MDRQVEIYTYLNLPSLILNYVPFLPLAKPSGPRTVRVFVVVVAAAAVAVFPLVVGFPLVVSTSTYFFFSLNDPISLHASSLSTTNKVCSCFFLGPGWPA